MQSHCYPKLVRTGTFRTHVVFLSPKCKSKTEKGLERTMEKILRESHLLSNSLFKKPHDYFTVGYLTRLGRLDSTEGLGGKDLVRRDSVRKSEDTGNLVLDEVRKKQALTRTKKYTWMYLRQQKPGLPPPPSTLNSILFYHNPYRPIFTPESTHHLLPLHFNPTTNLQISVLWLSTLAAY